MVTLLRPPVAQLAHRVQVPLAGALAAASHLHPGVALQPIVAQAAAVLVMVPLVAQVAQALSSFAT